MYTVQNTEPLIPTTLPQYLWQRIVTELFEWKGHAYLLVVDYYSRFIKVAKHLHSKSGTTSAEVVRHLKSIMAHHGIPAKLISDNGPQFSAGVFGEFTNTYGMQYTEKPLQMVWDL